MGSVKSGLPFFDVLKRQDGTFNEYVPADGFLGEYVTKLEQQSKASSESNNERSSSLDQPQTPTPRSQLPRWKRRTAEQIEANKLAQKRYREKKKAKLQQASAKVDTLQQQTQDFNALETEIRNKNTENRDLEAELLTLEAELQRIRIELDLKTPQAKFDQQAGVSCLGPQTLEKKTDSIGVKWKKTIGKIDALLAKEKLQPSGKPEISPSLKKQLDKRCAAAEIQCMEMLTYGGPALDDLLTTLPGGPSEALRNPEAEHYLQIVQFLNLQPEQTERIANLYEQMMKPLAEIYVKRANLNKEVLSSLVGNNQAEFSQANSSIEDRPRILRAALQDLEENLKEEQRLESKHHYIILREVLTSVQGAWFISKTYPRHCDTLAFMQAVYFSRPGARDVTEILKGVGGTNTTNITI